MFPMNVGDEFLDLVDQKWMQFKGMDDTETAMVFYANFDSLVVVLTILPLTFINAYISGRYQEVPGAGNIQEVVG